MGAPRSTPALRRRGLRQHHGRGAGQGPHRACRGSPAGDTLRHAVPGRDSLGEGEVAAERRNPLGLPLEVRGSRTSTVRRVSRSGPTAPARSSAPPRSRWTRPRAAAGASAPPASTTRSTSGPPACWGGGSTSTWTSTPSASTPATTTSRSTTRGSRTRSSGGWTSAPSSSSRRLRASSRPRSPPTTSASTPSSTSVRSSSRRSPPPRRGASWPSGATPSARPPARRRTARPGTSISRAAGSSGWWTRTACPARPRWTSWSSIPRRSRPPTARPRCGSTATARRAATAASIPTWAGSPPRRSAGTATEPLEPVRWELLIQGTDYYVDDSGLWIVLGTKLDQNDYLAVSFRTAAGTTIGSFPEVDQGPGSTDVLELIAEPQQNQTRRTFRLRDAQRLPRGRRGSRRHLAGGRHQPQPLRAAGHGLGPDLSPAARPRGCRATPSCSTARIASFPARRIPEASKVVKDRLHRLPAPRAVRRPHQALARPRSRTRSTARRSTCC